MPARDRLPFSPSPGDAEEHNEELSRGHQIALSRRKTTAFDERLDPALPSSHSSNAPDPRQSMPSRTANEGPTTPRSNQSHAQIGTSSHEITPKRTPISLGPTVDKRFEALFEHAGTILYFYQDYAERLKDPQVDLADDMDRQIARYWSVFSSARKHQIFPLKDNDDDFLDLDTVLQGNAVDPASELAAEINQKIVVANRATFAHLVAQLPFSFASPPAKSDFNPWSVDKLAEYLSQDKHDRWPIRDLEELLSARKHFFKTIVPYRRQSLVTLDDLHLYLDLCTQIAACYLWKLSIVKKASDRRAQVIQHLDFVFSASPLVDAFEDSEMRGLVEKTYKKMADDRQKIIEDLKYAPSFVQKEFPFQVTAAILINYINALRTSAPFPLTLTASPSGLKLPRNKDHIFSPFLRKAMSQREYSKGIQKGIEEDQDAEGEAVGEEEQPITARNTRLIIDKDSRLRRVEDTGERARSIVNRRGDVGAIRDIEFEPGDTDPFLQEQISRQKRNTATRGKGKKRAVPARRRNAPESKLSLREGDSDEGQPDAAPMSSLREAGNSQNDDLPDANTLLIRKGKAIQSNNLFDRQQQEGEIHEDADADADADADFEMDQVELQVTQSESEDRRAIQKRNRAEREESEYLPPSAGPSTLQKQSQSTQGSDESSNMPLKKPKQDRSSFRYATGGNQKGRSAWSVEERTCLLRDLEDLQPQYLEAQGRNVRFTVWKEVLKRHGANGTMSRMLKSRNNVQLKDKARNEIERRKRAQEVIPAWLAYYG